MYSKRDTLFEAGSRGHIAMALFSQHRPVTLARKGMVAAPHYLASQAGAALIHVQKALPLVGSKRG